MSKGLRTVAALALSLSLLTFLSPVIPSASAAACAVTYGTVSGTTRYAKFINGTSCLWAVPAGVTSLQYLVVGAGGGGGGAGSTTVASNLGGGGGGAGGIVISSTLSVSPSSAITLTIGTGGAGGAAGTAGGNGGATTLDYVGTNVTSTGGNGGGGSPANGNQDTLSGDGGSNASYSGGVNVWDGGGGGAGAGAAGVAGTDIGGQGGNGGAGGAGVASSILGTTYYYGGGGGGGGTPSANSNETDGTGAAGGSSVGGNGGGTVGGTAGALATAGAANTGSGGGGGGWRSTYTNAQRTGAAGSDGVIIFVYSKNAATISSISISSNAGVDNAYSIGNIISITVVTSEAVTVTGTPRIPIVGLTSKYFDYVSGSGSNSLIFSYTVASGDSVTAGVGVVANTLQLNSGSILDTSSLAIAITHTAITQASNHKVDGIMPSLVGVTQSPTVPENETRTINLTTSESVTISYTGINDRDYFVLDTSTAVATLTITPRDFESKLDANADNTYYVGLTLRDLAGNTTGSVNFFFTISDVAEAAAVGKPTLSAAAKKGLAVTITVTSDVAGKIDFYWNGKRIPGCLARPTSGTAPNFSATCAWKPATTSLATLKASIKPTSSSFSASTSPELKVLPSSRGTNR